jgi:ankyrin repeat protein
MATWHGASTNHHNDNRYGTTPLMESTRDGHVAIAQELLARGADINALDKHQDNALNWAVYFGQQPLVELLLAHQANFNQVGQQTQDNALDIARRQRFAAIAMLLEKAGAKPTK